MIKVYKDVEKYDLEEYCPHCDNYIPLTYDEDDLGQGVCLETVCPICGEKLMICTLCEHCSSGDVYERDDCDWCKEHGCHRDRAHTEKESDR